MPYETEDEIDWSDGTLDTPAPAYHEPATAYMYPSLDKVDDEQYDALFESDSAEKCFDENVSSEQFPVVSCVLPNDDQHISPSSIDAETGPLEYHRVPSKEDYVKFALYQASQKAYEATLFKQFVAHALHHDQIKDCFTGNGTSPAKLDRYLALINANVDEFANKMIWNANHRVFHMLANEDRDAATFLHVHNLHLRVFDDFGPGCTSSRLASSEINESWHRAFLQPDMIRLSATELPLGRHTHPLEDLDDYANATISNQVRDNASSISCNSDAPVETSEKSKALPLVAHPLEPAPVLHIDRRETLTPLINANSHCELSDHVEDFMAIDGVEPVAQPIFSEGRQIEHPSCEHEDRTSFTNMPAQYHSSPGAPTQLEMLFEKHGADALASDRPDSSTGSDTTSAIIKVPSWSQKLLLDHKRRLTERWGDPQQALNSLLPGFEEVITQSMAKGCRPTAPDWYDRAREVDIREKDSLSTRINPVMKPVPTIPKQSQSGTNSNSNDISNGEVPRPCVLATSIEMGTVAPTPPSAKPAAKKRKIEKTIPAVVRPRKKQSIVKSSTLPRSSAKSSALSSSSPLSSTPTSATTDASLPPHPSGSKTLELDQHLPPGAYFSPSSPDDKPAWRCSIKHALGHYYNAGDRKACRGCNTSLMDIPKVKHMDFYLPHRTFSHQPAPSIRWKPCRPSGKPLKNTRGCHNSVAKYAFWAAVDAGHTEDQAREIGRTTLLQHLAPKPRKETTPEPIPEPKPDLGPHPSGSDTMEHGQDLPECAYSSRQHRHEDHAWRCDVSHALGRYYLAGDKKSCPGCGTNKGGVSRQTNMDFFLPPGTIIRQEAPGIVKWKPRKYKGRAGAVKNAKAKHSTHNQVCAEKYFTAKTEGLDDEDALKRAVEQTDEWLDGKMEELNRRYAEQEEEEDGAVSRIARADSVMDVTMTDPVQDSNPDAFRSNDRGGCTVSLIPAKRSGDDFDDDMNGSDSLFGDDEGADQEMPDIPAYHEVFEVEEEESSESDSE